MAETPGVGGGTDQREKPQRSFTWLWMILALVTVAGFLTWLGVASEPTSVAVVEEDPMDDPMVPTVVKDTLAANEARFLAQRIRVRNVAATGILGDRIFWGELGNPSNQQPMLMRLDSAAAADFEPQVGTRYMVMGAVAVMTDSLATEWLEAGDLAGEGERLQAAFADFFMQVERIRPMPASERGSGTGSTSGGGAAADSGQASGGAGTS